MSGEIIGWILVCITLLCMATLIHASDKGWI